MDLVNTTAQLNRTLLIVGSAAWITTGPRSAADCAVPLLPLL